VRNIGEPRILRTELDSTWKELPIAIRNKIEVWNELPNAIRNRIEVWDELPNVLRNRTEVWKELPAAIRTSSSTFLFKKSLNFRYLNVI